MIIVHIIIGLAIGGAENQLVELYKRQKFVGKRVRIVILTNQIHHKFESIEVTKPNDFHSNIFLALPMMFMHLIKSDIDILHTWMYHSDLFGALLKLFKRNTKLFWSIRNSRLGKGSNPILYLVALVNGLLSHFLPHKIFSVSKDAIGFHKKLGYSSRKMTFMPNGYNIDLEDMKSFKTRPFIIGSLGRYNTFKGHDFLVETIQELGCQNTWYLAGRNVDRSNVVFKPILHCNRVSYIGEITDVDGFFKSIDVLFLHSRSEGFPNVVFEAILRGCLVISTSVSNVKDYLPANMIIDYGDVKGFLRVLSMLQDSTVEECRLLQKTIRDSCIEELGIKYIESRINMIYLGHELS
jgi:glycosyltransferase involved in cell wall biosynthesis